MRADRPRRRGGAAALALASALGLGAWSTGAAAPRRAAEPATASPDAWRAGLAGLLTDEVASVDAAVEAVDAKLAAVQAARVRRLAAAARALRSAAGGDAMASARRRSAARLLAERDRGERALLVDELAQLRAARGRIERDAAQLPTIELPGSLRRPAAGKIARKFGTLAHERSRTTLARRGIDLEVDAHAQVVAPAAGTVRYAGPIRGLDQGVILDHGSYLTVIGKLGELALPVGAPIGAGDRLGRAARHRVYLEVRVKLGPGGLPIDPEPLLDGAQPPDAR